VDQQVRKIQRCSNGRKERSRLSSRRTSTPAKRSAGRGNAPGRIQLAFSAAALTQVDALTALDLQILPVEDALLIRDIGRRSGEEMKRQIFRFMAAAVIAAALAVQAPAQDIGSLGKQAQSLGGVGDISTIAQKLHLSPEQMKQVMPILQGEMPKLQAIKGDPKLSTDQKQTQTKAVQQQSDSKLKTILSPQQFGSLQGIRAQQLQGLVPH
jgi:hypothetical protein